MIILATAVLKARRALHTWQMIFEWQATQADNLPFMEANLPQTADRFRLRAKLPDPDALACFYVVQGRERNRRRSAVGLWNPDVVRFHSLCQTIPCGVYWANPPLFKNVPILAGPDAALLRPVFANQILRSNEQKTAS